MKVEISEFNHLSSASFFKKPEPLAKTAVLIPCYNEELTIADVVQQYRVQLPRRNPTATSNLYVQMRVTESLQSV